MSDSQSLADYRWLVSPAATPWLHQAAASTAPLHTQAVRLRRDLTASQAHLVLEQVELRRRAARKFRDCESMFFTRVSLEQATDEFVAAYKAARFPASEPVADLCCGIGGDLLALAKRGPATGIDLDPVAALLAEANCLAVLGPLAMSAVVRCADVTDCDLREFAAWHIDPDRRARGVRTTRVEFYEPASEAIDAMLAANPNAAIKLAPAATVPTAWSDRAELEWISRGGECRQLMVWAGELTQSPATRRATLVNQQGAVRTICASESQASATLMPVTPTLGRYLYEPDAAVLAAHLTSVLAAEHGLAAVAHDIAYLTGDALLFDPALATFDIAEVFPFQIKRAKQILRARNIGRLEIKKRGVDYDPETVRKQLDLQGDEGGVLLLTRVNNDTVGIVAQRISHA